jgi:hypothetical protein
MSGRTSSAAPSRLRLAERRRLRRRRGWIAFSAACVLLAGLLVWGLWQAPVRIAHITVYDATPPGSPGGASADADLAAIARAALGGTYLGIIPRDSTFFAPLGRIRAAVLAARPGLAAVSIFRDGFTALSVKVDARTPIARWCGPAPLTTRAPTFAAGGPAGAALATATSAPATVASPTPAAPCYLFDDAGFVYARARATSTPLHAFVLYGSLATTTVASAPVGATLADASALPAVFDFARELAGFGAPVVSIAIHDGVVDDRLASGTRVTYLLGEEQQAYAALVSARADLPLASGALEYVDLTFPGKVYLKRVPKP